MIMYSLRPSGAEGKELGFQSSRPDVAEVSRDGLVTAGKGGSTVITAASRDGITDSLTVFVYDGELPGFSIGSRIDFGGTEWETVQGDPGLLRADGRGSPWRQGKGA